MRFAVKHAAELVQPRFAVAFGFLPAVAGHRWLLVSRGPWATVTRGVQSFRTTSGQPVPVVYVTLEGNTWILSRVDPQSWYTELYATFQRDWNDDTLALWAQCELAVHDFHLNRIPAASTETDTPL